MQRVAWHGKSQVTRMVDWLSMGSWPTGLLRSGAA